MRFDRRRRRALVVVVAFVVLAVSLLPGSGTPSVGNADKLFHASGYALLAWLGASALPATSRADALRVLLAVTLFGAGIEVVQPVVGRNASLLDAMANLGGAIAGLVIWCLQAN